MCVCVHAQLCPTLCDPVRYSQPGSSARILNCWFLKTEIEATQLIVSFLNPTLWKFADGRGQKSVKAPRRSVYVTHVTYAALPKCWCNPPHRSCGGRTCCSIGKQKPCPSTPLLSLLLVLLNHLFIMLSRYGAPELARWIIRPQF